MRRDVALALVTLLALTLCPRRGEAWGFSLWDRDFTLDVTNTFEYTYHFENGDTDPNNDEFHQFLNLLDVSLSHGEFRLGTRLDLNLFAGAGDLGPVDTGIRYEQDFRPQKLYFIWARDAFDLTLGDFYASFGKGLALNVIKVDELGQDTTVRGGKFQLHDGDLTLTFVGGQFNPLAVDTSTGYEPAWNSESVVGGRAEYSLLETVIAGAHAVYVMQRNHLDEKPGLEAHHDWSAIWGMGAEVPDLLDGMLAFAGEVNVQTTSLQGRMVRGHGHDEGGTSGVGAYASSTAQLGDLTLLGEFKYYDDFSLKYEGSDDSTPYTLMYHQPPTLDRMRATIKNNTHVSGFRLRADYYFGQVGFLDAIIAYANYGYFRGWDAVSEDVHVPFGGVELQWMEGVGQLQLEAGLRRVELAEDPDKGKLQRQDLHLEASLEQALVARHSVTLTFTFLDRQEELLGLQKWKEIELAVSYKWSPYFDVALFYERQEDPKFGDPQDFFGGSARYFITPSTYVSVLAGENKPGIKCINGVCRDSPAFSGVRVTAVGRF